MKRKVRVAQYGIGAMGSNIARYVLAHGGELVAGFARSERQTGRDLGEVIGVGALGVPVTDFRDAERVLRESGADICVIATKGRLSLIHEAFAQCARAGVDAITIAENAAWPWTEEPEEAAALDALAREAGVTFAASGCPEVPWGTLAATMCAAHERVTKVRVAGTLNLDVFGGAVSELFEAHGVNCTPEEFQRKFAALNGGTDENGHAPCLPGDQNGWMCRYLGLTPVRQYVHFEPITHPAPVPSRLLGGDIAPGRLLGMVKSIVTETAEGVEIEYAMSGLIAPPDMEMGYSITIYGEPERTEVFIREPDSLVYTCATPVNRIPDVINARPGYLTSESFPRSRFRFRPLNEYVERDG